MYYLYEKNRLVPLRQGSEESIALAKLSDGILVTNKIDEAILIAHYPKSAFLLHSKNVYSLFSYWRHQLRHRTLKEFRIIIYAAPKRFLYGLLSFVSWISFGTYSLITF